MTNAKCTAEKQGHLPGSKAEWECPRHGAAARNGSQRPSISAAPPSTTTSATFDPEAYEAVSKQLSGAKQGVYSAYRQYGVELARTEATLAAEGAQMICPEATQVLVKRTAIDDFSDDIRISGARCEHGEGSWRDFGNLHGVDATPVDWALSSFILEESWSDDISLQLDEDNDFETGHIDIGQLSKTPVYASEGDAAERSTARAAGIVQTYNSLHLRDESKVAAKDMVTDLFHWATKNGIDLDEIISGARDAFEDEREEAHND